jgi:hypothetical protein
VKPLIVRAATVQLVLLSFVPVVAIIATATSAFGQPPVDQAQREIVDPGIPTTRCASFVTLSRDFGSTSIVNLVGAWADGYATGLAAGLEVMTQEPVRSAFATTRDTATPDEITNITAIVMASVRGSGLLINASMKTRASQLADYCQQHPNETLTAAVANVWISTWLRLPQLPPAK